MIGRDKDQTYMRIGAYKTLSILVSRTSGFVWNTHEIKAASDQSVSIAFQ